MAHAANAGISIHWRAEGDTHKPALVLLNSIATTISLYDDMAPMLTADFRLLRIDTRGHGGSAAPSGDYSLDALADDVLAVMDAAEVKSAIVCGTSLGGMMAMALALRAPARVDALALVCTSAAMEGPFWPERVAKVRSDGVASIADAAIGRFFSPGFAAQHPGVIENYRHAISAMSTGGYAGCSAAIRDMQLMSRLGAINVPCMVVGGAFDTATPFAGHGDRIVSAIAKTEKVMLQVGHLASVEDPAGLARAVRQLAARSTQR